jgi:TolB protein
MRTINRSLLTAFIALIALIALPALATAQEPTGVRLGLLYQPEYQPGFVVLPFGGEDAAEYRAPLRNIISQDLDYSDRFEMREGAAGVGPNAAVDLTLWKERGADFVLQGALRDSGPGAVLRLVLHDAVYGRVREEQLFILPPLGDPGFRMAVHAISDEVVRWATGDPGSAATRVAFVRQGPDSKEIYLVDYDGENVRRLTTDGSIALSPAWSPDGARLAYTSYRSGRPLLYERQIGGGDRVISDRDGVNITPAYAPDGRAIAFATSEGGNTEVATYDRARNCCLRMQTRGRRFDSLSPSFSPDGARMAFVSNRLGEPHIYVMAVGGGEPRLISDYSYGGRGYNTSPAWSPRANAVAYHSQISGIHHIVLADLDTGGRRFLTNVGNNEDPSWAPDGRHVVFSSKDRDGGGLFVLDTVSGRVRPLLRGSGYGLPDWSPALETASPVAQAPGGP